MTLPTVLVLFAAFGALFGLLTHAKRHLFSEGPSRPQADDAGDLMRNRLAWTVLCAVLWPLMALTGLYGWWVRRGR